MLALLEYYDLKSTAPRSTFRVHLTAEVMARAFADRNTYLADPEFVRVPTIGLLSPKYIASVQRTILMDRASRPGGVRPGDPWPFEPGGASALVTPDAFDTLRTCRTGCCARAITRLTFRSWTPKAMSPA